MRNFVKSAASILLFLVGVPSSALDLQDAWQLARSHSPEFQGARSAVAAEKEGISLARAKMLPVLRASGTVTRNQTERAVIDQVQPWLDSRYTAQRGLLQFSQPILPVAAIYELRAAKAQALAAEFSLDAQEQALGVSVAQAFFDVILAQKQRDASVQRVAFSRTALSGAEMAFAKGAASRTDIDDARARLDAALADEIDAGAGLGLAEQALSSLTGSPLSYSDLSRLSVNTLVPETLSPETSQGWISLASQHSGSLAALRKREDVASSDVERIRASRLPIIELVANKSLSRSDNESLIGYKYKTDAVGLQFSVPIYTGGAINAQVRKAVALRDKSGFDYDAALGKLSLDVSREFVLTKVSVAKIRALKVALDSAQNAVVGNEKGFRAGTRNIVDVLNAQQQELQVQVALEKAANSYVVSLLKLKALAGVLEVADMRRVSGWLEGK